MILRPVRLVLAALLLAGGLRWIWNSNRWSGPVVMTLSDAHGVHLNDWLTFVCWLTAFVVACPVWTRVLALRARRVLVERQR